MQNTQNVWGQRKSILLHSLEANHACIWLMCMTGTLYLLLIAREGTPSDAHLILRLKKQSSIIAVPFEHANQATTASRNSRACGSDHEYLLCAEF